QGGFTIASASLTVLPGAVPFIGSFLGFGSITVSVTNFQLVYATNSTATTTTGTIGVHATDVVLFPNIGFINKNIGTLDGSYSFHSPAILSFTLPTLDLPIGGALNIHAEGVTFNPGGGNGSDANVLMSIASATISSPSFPALGTATI